MSRDKQRARLAVSDKTSEPRTVPPPGSPATLYDQVPYPSGTFPETHPAHLATLAHLHGLEAPDARTARVLELGSASGGNLLPLAFEFPGARMLGLDLSAREIADGAAWVERLGLANLELRHQDILDFEAEPGSFDYVIVHGVYSWVPERVRERILAIAARVLAPRGIAYVSYNAQPGGHFRDALRDMMRFHVREIADPTARVRQARSFCQFLGDSIPPAHELYTQLIRREAERIAKLDDTHLVHDDLAAVNDSFFFHEFAAAAARHGLGYLTDARFSEVQGLGLAEPVRRTLAALPDRIVYEQYLDFVACRAFRRSVLCRGEFALTARLDPGRLEGLHFRANARPVSEEPDVASSAPERFRHDSGVVMGLTEPLAKAAMLALHRRAPRPLSFDALVAEARRLLASAEPGFTLAPEPADRTTMAELLLECYRGDMVRARLWPPAFAEPGAERPEVSPLARQQAQAGVHVTNLWHENVKLDDPFAAVVLARLDGSRSRADLVSELVRELEAGRLALKDGEQKPAGREARRTRLEAELSATLSKMARFALLRG